MSNVVNRGLVIVVGLFLFAVALSLPVGDCTLDSAVVTFVPPNSHHVVAYTMCGSIPCWSRWIDNGGRIIGLARVCSDNTGGNQERLTTTPTPDSPVTP